MAKKKPALETQTQRQKDNAAYAGVVLAGVVLRRRVSPARHWRHPRTGWYIEHMPKAITYLNGPYLTRRLAVAYAQRALEMHS